MSSRVNIITQIRGNGRHATCAASYFTIADKPGYGIELNPDVARAQLAPGETWWG